MEPNIIILLSVPSDLRSVSRGRHQSVAVFIRCTADDIAPTLRVAKFE